MTECGGKHQTLGIDGGVTSVRIRSMRLCLDSTCTVSILLMQKNGFESGVPWVQLQMPLFVMGT